MTILELNQVKNKIEETKNINEEKELLNILQVDNNLTSLQKNLIFLYQFPRPLLDRELPSRIKSSGIATNDANNITDQYIILLVEAYRTTQYSRFIRHLLHTFINNVNLFTLLDAESVEDGCPICGKKLVEKDKALENGDIGIGSKYSRINLCLHCTLAISKLDDWLKIIEGPYYLESPKRG